MADAIRLNSTLTRLDLSENNLGPQGMVLLADSLRTTAPSTSSSSNSPAGSPRHRNSHNNDRSTRSPLPSSGAGAGAGAGVTVTLRSPTPLRSALQASIDAFDTGVGSLTLSERRSMLAVGRSRVRILVLRGNALGANGAGLLAEALVRDASFSMVRYAMMSSVWCGMRC